MAARAPRACAARLGCDLQKRNAAEQLRALLRRYQAALALVRDPYVQQFGQLAARAVVKPR
jgi:hypothetical protein